MIKPPSKTFETVNTPNGEAKQVTPTLPYGMAAELFNMMHDVFASDDRLFNHWQSAINVRQQAQNIPADTPKTQLAVAISAGADMFRHAKDKGVFDLTVVNAIENGWASVSTSQVTLPPHEVLVEDFNDTQQMLTACGLLQNGAQAAVKKPSVMRTLFKGALFDLADVNIAKGKLKTLSFN